MRAYDPEGMEQARAILENVTYAEHAYACMSGADALVIVTEWDEFRALDLARVKALLRPADPCRPAQHLSAPGHGKARIHLRWRRPRWCAGRTDQSFMRTERLTRHLQSTPRTADGTSRTEGAHACLNFQTRRYRSGIRRSAHGRIGVLLLNLGTPDGTGLLADAPLSQGVSRPITA